MTPQAYYTYVRQQLLLQGDPEQAAGQAAYMRYQFEFIGLKTPLRRALAKRIFTELGVPVGTGLVELLHLCAADEYRELNYFALDLAEKAIKQQPDSFIEQLEALVLTNPWWDTVDWLAKLIGMHFKAYPYLIQPTTERWMGSGELWLQRVCLIFQLHYKQETDEAMLFDYILRLRQSDEFFIQKAAGWALRQYSRTAPAAVRAFLDAHPDLPTLTRREGGRRL